MNSLKNLPVLALLSLVLSFNASVCSAADLVWPEMDKEDIFKIAIEQDRFVLLFVGNYPENCSHCRRALEYFNDPSKQLRSFIDDNYVTWFVPYYDRVTGRKNDLEQVALYVADYEYTKYQLGLTTTFPILAVINPSDPEDFTFFWSSGSKTEKQYYDFIAAPPDLFAGQQLTWHKDKNEAFNLAKAQGKPVFKLIGKSTSPNTKKVMKQLTAEPLKSMLDKHFILWFSADVSEINLNTYAEASAYTFPYISLIDPDEPDESLLSLSGYHTVETFEEIMKPFTVSNEWVALDNFVAVSGNTLHISNGRNNERIQVFTMAGQQVASIRKNGYSVTMDASSFPKGMLIIGSSSGWSQKIVIQ